MTARSSEPVVLPARFPNLLANGATGIAVGMATSIPPHNAGELCDALLHLIKHPDTPRSPSCSTIMPGPDFPTGGVLVEAAGRDPARPTRPAAAASALRAKWRSREAGSTASGRSSSPRSPTRCRNRA